MVSFKSQNAISLVLLLLSFLAIWVMSPAIEYLPHGLAYSFAPEKTLPAVNKSDVQLLQQFPFSSQKLGKVRVEISLQGMQGEHRDAMFEYARELAGGLGANAVVVEAFGQLADVLVLEGTAIEI